MNCHLEYITNICYILWQFGTFCGHFWYIFPRFGTLYQEKFGNPGKYEFCNNFFYPQQVFCFALLCFCSCPSRKQKCESASALIKSAKWKRSSVSSRVTRLGEFSPLGWLFKWCLHEFSVGRRHKFCRTTQSVGRHECRTAQNFCFV
jgi:hypothetical protein